MLTPAPARTREHLADSLTIHGARVLETAHATDAVLHALAHEQRRGALALAKDATGAAREGYLSFVALRDEVLQAVAQVQWDGIERRAA